MSEDANDIITSSEVEDNIISKDQGVENLRHLTKRSPICKRSASPCIIAKTLKKKKLFAKKVAKLVKFGAPAAALGAASNAPALLAPLAELGVIGAVGEQPGDWARRLDLRSPSNSAALLVDESREESERNRIWSA